MDHYLIMSSHNELYHHGIQGMKWGVRRFQNKDGSLTSAGKKRYDDNGKMKQLDTDTTVTRKVKNDYNNMNDGDFRRKYGTSKSTYAKRVEKSKTGDPFADNPVTKNAIRITTNAINKENKKVQALEKDIRSFDSIKDGLVDKKGRVILSKDDVKKSVDGLINEQSKHLNRIKEYTKQVSATSTVRYNTETNKYEVFLKGRES